MHRFPLILTAYIVNDVAAGVLKNKNPLGSSITVDGKRER